MKKVKKNSDPFRSLIFLGFFAVVIAYFHFTGRPSNSYVNQVEESFQNQSNSLPADVAQNRMPLHGARDSMPAGGDPSPVPSNSPSPHLLGIPVVEASKAAVASFEQNARMSVRLPEDLNFVPLDLEESMASIYGSNPHTNIAMAVVAAPMDATPSQAAQYVAENLGTFPNTRGHSIRNWSAPQNLSVSPQSGLKSATLLSTQMENGEALHLVLLNRSDGKGTYFFLASGKGGYFSDNEDRFDEALRSFKAHR